LLTKLEWYESKMTVANKI